MGGVEDSRRTCPECLLWVSVGYAANRAIKPFRAYTKISPALPLLTSREKIRLSTTAQNSCNQPPIPAEKIKALIEHDGRMEAAISAYKNQINCFEAQGCVSAIAS